MSVARPNLRRNNQPSYPVSSIPLTWGQWLATGSVAAALGGFVLLRANTNDMVQDLKIVALMVRAKRSMTALAAVPSWNVADYFEGVAARFPHREALVYVPEKDEPSRKTSYTYAEIDQEANRLGHVLLTRGLQRGQVVSVLMDNRPEYLITWLAIAKCGAIAALINTNLRGPALDHCLRLSEAVIHLVGQEHVQHISPELLRDLSGRWYACAAPGSPAGAQYPEPFHALEPELALSSSSPVPRAARAGRTATDTMWYIYTSGTTGMPKAAKVTSLRLAAAGFAFSRAYGVTGEDRIYCTLPMYHSAGGLIGVGLMMETGGTLVIRRRFSARNFWADCQKERCTVVQYIGELCRYLLQSPPSPYDKAHAVRVAIGNGMRPDIWRAFQDRFHVGLVGEFYAATEGNVTVFNGIGKEGAVGYLAPLLRLFYPLAVVRFDLDTEQPVRDPRTGFCLPCAPGEAGEMLGLIDTVDPLRAFPGYTNADATRKKVLTDVFRKGDAYFRTGDLMRIDREGFVYFVDRIGDTFRWKGENVATTEVAEQISRLPGVKEVNVFGVSVPHHDGRAGMALIIPEGRDKFDVKKLYDGAMKALPPYAAPLFLRVQEEGGAGGMDVTGTFKHRKVDYVKQGIDPTHIADKMYIRDDNKRTFVPFDSQMYKQLANQTYPQKL